MDINDDGIGDIISGNYATEGMISHFQVLWGSDDGFKTAETLKGSDGKPLVIHHKEVSEGDYDDELFCTRIFAADINGDGHLDLVAGNYLGSFYLFEGQGKGKFDPKATILKSGESTLNVSGHSDPCLFDWDGDGDLDLLSGAGCGGVNYAENIGSKTEPSFKEFVSLIEPAGHNHRKGLYGDSNISAPGASTRVCVGDVNGDGLFDLLVGDYVRFRFLANGVKESEVENLLEEWNTKWKVLADEREKLEQELDVAVKQFGKSGSADDLKEYLTIAKKIEAHSKKELPLVDKRSGIIRDQPTGHIWVYYQLPKEN